MPRRHRLTIHPFGVRLTIESDEPRVIDAARFALARYPGDAGLGGDLTLVATALPGRPAAWPKVAVAEHDDGIEVTCGGSTLRTFPGEGRCTLAIDDCLARVDDAVRMFVEAALWSPLIAGDRLRAVHSGLVSWRGAGLLLRGPSGAGKSTLTYACLRGGMEVVSDDWVYGVAGRRPDRLWGYPWRMWMTIDASARFAELAAVPPRPHPGADRMKVPVEPPPHRRRVAASVAAVVLIDRDGDLGLRQVDQGEATERFVQSALDSERGSLPAAWVDELLDRPCYVLRRGTSPDAAAELLRDLAARSATSTA